MVTRMVLASHNPKKVRELQQILEPLGIELVSLAEFPGAEPPEEDGETFEDNARIKAEAARRLTGLPALADDSGLAVDALGGAPGVRSARFAGENASDADNNRALLRNMAGLTGKERRARFVSAVCFVPVTGEPVTFRGETEGIILEAEQGSGGFGYDPLFLSRDLGVTFAEASPEEKNRISHRGRALAQLREYLQAAAAGGKS